MGFESKDVTAADRVRGLHFPAAKRKRLPGKIPGSREVLSLSEEVTEQEAVLSHLRAT
jgi:hypothetical protein